MSYLFSEVPSNPSIYAYNVVVASAQDYGTQYIVKFILRTGKQEWQYSSKNQRDADLKKVYDTLDSLERK